MKSAINLSTAVPLPNIETSGNEKCRLKRLLLVPALRILICTSMLLTTSCATAPERNAVDMTKSPPQWASANASNNPIATQWLSSFADPALSAVVQDALNNNYDLKAAAARVDSAREQARIDGAARWPQLSLLSFPRAAWECSQGALRREL